MVGHLTLREMIRDLRQARFYLTLALLALFLASSVLIRAAAAPKKQTAARPKASPKKAAVKSAKTASSTAPPATSLKNQLTPLKRPATTAWPNSGNQDRPLTLAERVEAINPDAVARALADMAKSWPARIAPARNRALLSTLSVRRTALLRDLKNTPTSATTTAAESLVGEVRAALLANPLLDFDRLLLIQRAATAPKLALPQNWESNSSIPRKGIDNTIAILNDLRGAPQLAPLYKPEGGKFAGDLTLHFDAARFLFSSIGADGRWGVFEMNLDPSATPRQLPLIPDADVDNYTATYLPDESILFTSTAPFIGVPCVRGSSHVAHLYRYWPATGKIRRLTFDQEHNWCPTLLHDGRVLYLRWEYADLPHFVARILFTMNPDGTNQREFYGSGSYWPNSFFYAKPMPGDPRKVCGIVGGHHGVARMGELVIVDPALGRIEADGVVQRVPGWGQKVEPVLLDNLVDASWPKFLHPAPLSDKYLITACKPSPTALWGIYLVDVFDNLTLIKELPGQALLEPVPLQKTPRPPVIPDRVSETSKTAQLQIADIYQGPGLAGVPRGTVKRLRLLTYDFAYHGMGGQWDRIGLDGPWDVKRIIGTVPVEADGSANFEVPANLPIAMQPLDERGCALALMRSWTTAMPGEVQSCLGCHERQNNTSAAIRNTLAMRKPPARIAPFYGPLRGFSFEREVQPVLDRHCVSCHNGKALPDFTRRPMVYAGSTAPGYDKEVKFPPAYLALKAFVRTPTIENDIHLLNPGEFHASTTALMQLLEAGHHGVKLDAESWDRLFTWIDLNTPAHGTWEELVSPKKMKDQRQRRRELTLRYAGLDDDQEAVYPAPDWKLLPPPAAPHAPAAAKLACQDWPFATDAAARRQRAVTPSVTTLTLDLGGGVELKLARIPAGHFVAGGAAAPARLAEIARPFWIGATEVTNAQFARFDSTHDSRLEHGDFLQFSTRERGYPLNEPSQPVCRVSWNEAQAFCHWLAARSGRKVALPSGEAWEWACRAGAATALNFGAVNADFSRCANLADANLHRMPTFGWGLPSGAVPEWRPAVADVDDGFVVAAPVGSFATNAWGLRDMHGNVWEWTRDLDVDGVRRIVRGGSWYSRPRQATADAALPYQPWQKVYDVGFRVVIEE